jgi:hypothetical protein
LFVTKVNAAALESTRDEERRAADFKTPQRKKRSSMDLGSTEQIGISPYARSLLNGPEEFEDMSGKEQLTKLIQMVINLDAGVDQLGSFYVSMNQEVANSGNVQGLSNQMLEHKVNLIRRTLGTKPEHFKSEMEAPTVWGAMATILEHINASPGELQTPRRHGHSPSPAEWTKRMTAINADLMATASTLSKAIQAQGHRIDTLQNAGGTTTMPGRSVESLSTISLMEDIKGMRSDIVRINAENKPRMVKFAGLNLDSLAKARAWISSHVASEDIGLVVDPHTVFKHIYANVSGGEFLKNFERVHKLNISMLAQGYSMSTLQQAIPKVLSKGGSAVIKDDLSYLSKRPTWSDWDCPDTGLQESLKQELEAFKNAHRLEIENMLDQESRIYTVACLA